MDSVDAILERLKALWAKLERAKPHTPAYDALKKEIRAESNVYRALGQAAKEPSHKRTDSTEGS